MVSIIFLSFSFSRLIVALAMLAWHGAVCPFYVRYLHRKHNGYVAGLGNPWPCTVCGALPADYDPEKDWLVNPVRENLPSYQQGFFYAI